MANRGELHVEFEGPSRSVPIADEAATANARELLVRGLAKLEAGPQAGAAAP